MVKPAAPWFGWGLVMWLVSALVGLTSLPFGGVALAFVGSVLLAVGVYRLVQHADRAAGYVPRVVPDADDRAHRADLERQARVRAALADAAGDRPGVRDEGEPA